MFRSQNEEERKEARKNQLNFAIVCGFVLLSAHFYTSVYVLRKADSVIKLTTQTPFTDWAGLKAAYRSLPVYNVTSPAAQLSILRASWCDRTSWSSKLPDGCVCIANVTATLIQSSNARSAVTFPPDLCEIAVSSSLKCMTKRPRWDVSMGGTYSGVSPVYTCAAMAAIGVSVFFSFYFGTFDWFCHLIMGGCIAISVVITMAVGGAGVRTVPMIVVFAGLFRVGVLKNTDNMLIDYVWVAMPYVAALSGSLVMASHRLRDSYGVVAAGILCFVTSQAATQAHFCRRRFKGGSYLEYILGSLATACIVGWVGYFAIFITQWLGDIPISSPYAFLVSLLILVGMQLFEFFMAGASNVPDADSFGMRAIGECILFASSIAVACVFSVLDVM